MRAGDVGRFLVAFVLAALVLSPTGGAVKGATPHVVLISIDGLKPETYTQPGSADIPTLRQLAHRGAFARGVAGVFPTVTYPSHTTMITGVPPAVHGIYGNRILDPGDRSNAAWYWYARDIAVPTLVGLVRARGLRAAVVNWPVSVGMDADFLLPEFSRSSHPESLSLLRALSKPSTLVDDVESARGQALPWPLTDETRTEVAAWVLRVHRPELLLLHIFETDSAQHDYGPGSPEALSAIAGADRNVAAVIDAIDAAGLRDTTNVVIVSDHGFLPIKQQLQLNAAFKAQRWLRIDAKGRVTDWDVYCQPSGGSAFVYLSDAHDAPLRARVWRVLEDIAGDPANGVERVIPTDELRSVGADPRATFAVDMKDGFYTGSGVDRLLRRTASKGGHGHFPSRVALHASLILAGPAVPPTGDLGIVRMTQIAPTIASWFDVALSPMADKPLTLGRR